MATTTRTTPGAAWAGWIIFAASMLLIIGTINIIEGIVTLVDNTRVVVVQDRLVAVSLTGWGWTLLIFGALMIAAGLGLFAAQTWARITAIVLVGVHAIIQVGWLAAYPVWSMLMIGLDVVVLYALTARWAAIKDYADPYGSEREGRMGHHAPVG